MLPLILLAPGATAVAVAADPPADADSLQITEVVVTAQRRSERVQEVPAAISAVSGDSLRALGINQPGELQNIIPSMIGGTLRGDTVLAIRGVGLTVLGSAPGVAVHVDGVYQARASLGDLAQVDIERVEVLRGPQGTLYGRNANGGVVNYHSRAPGSEFSGYALARYETLDEFRLQGAVDIPLGDKVRMRVTGDRWERGEGVVENVTAGPDLDAGQSWFGRIRLDADLTDNLTGSLVANFLDREGSFVYFTNTARPLPVAVANNPPLAGIIVPDGDRRTSQNGPTNQDRRYTSIAGTLEWRSPSDTYGIKSITGYQDFDDSFVADFDGSNVDLVRINQGSVSKTLTQELNFSITTDRISAVIGGFYFDDDLDGALDVTFPLGVRNIVPPMAPSIPLPPGGRVSSVWAPYTTETLAAFGDFTLKLNDQWRLIGGIRYSEDTQEIVQANAIRVPTPGGLVSIPATVCNQTTRREESETTPRAGVQYDMTADNHVYATASRGFKVGGFNFRNGCALQFDGEEVTAYEFGSKNRFLDGRLTVNASAFYYDYTDLQVEQLVGFAFVLENAPKARIMGFELETQAQPSPNVTIYANLSFLDAEFRQFSNLDILDVAAGNQNLAGRPLPNAPDFSGSAGVAYRTGPVLAGGALTLRGDVSHKSRINYREFGNVLDSQEAYTLLNASVEWRSESGAFSARVFGKNLTDAGYIGTLAQSPATGTRFVSWGLPRQVGLELMTTF